MQRATQFHQKRIIIVIKVMRKINKFVQISVYNTNAPLLQSTVDPLKPKQLPRQFKRDMEVLVNTAAEYQVVSLSANQIRMNHRVFAILKEPLICAGQWGGYEYKANDYELIGNPERIGEAKLKFKDFQECPSVPGMRFAVWNPILQTYSFQLINFKDKEPNFSSSQRTLKAFSARLWDHEVRHLDGFLPFAEKISHGEVYVTEEFKDNPGMHEMVELMKRQIKLMGEQSMKRFFENPSEANKAKSSFSVSADELPQKITKELKSKFLKQKSKIQQNLQKEKLKPQDQE